VTTSEVTSAPTPNGPRVAGVRSALSDRRRSTSERAYSVVRWGGATVFVGVFLALLVTLIGQSSSAFSHMGLSILWKSWNPATSQFGAGPFIAGTLMTTAIALIIAVPIGVGAALWLTELAPSKVSGVIGGAIEFLAAIPSIVIGLWGLIVLTPIFTSTVEPALKSIPVVKYLATGQAVGSSLLLAGVVLAIMILPTIVALSRVALRGVPLDAREAGRALGATRWQVARGVVLTSARRGVGASIILAMGRALGEAIAVALVIGNRVAVPHSLLAPASTLGSAVVNFFAEADPGSLERSGVVALVVVLLFISVLVNVGGQLLLRKRNPAQDPPLVGNLIDNEALAVEGWGPDAMERRSLFRASAASSLRGRRRKGRALSWLCGVGVAVALVPLIALVSYVIAKGAPALSWSFLTGNPTPEGVPGNGIGNAIVGTAIILALAIAMAVPISLAAALFTTERPGRLANTIGFLGDVLSGTPSIAIGVFAYVIVVTQLGYSGFAGSVALAVLMLPIMLRANETAIGAVATDLRDAGLALGARRGRVARSVVLRTALPGLVSGNILATARAVGETAPLLFTIFGSQFLVFAPGSPMSALPLTILNNANQAFSDAQQTAWGAALVLMIFVVVLSTAARLIAGYLNRKAR